MRKFIKLFAAVLLLLSASETNAKVRVRLRDVVRYGTTIYINLNIVNNSDRDTNVEIRESNRKKEDRTCVIGNDGVGYLVSFPPGGKYLNVPSRTFINTDLILKNVPLDVTELNLIEVAVYSPSVEGNVADRYKKYNSVFRFENQPVRMAENVDSEQAVCTDPWFEVSNMTCNRSGKNVIVKFKLKNLNSQLNGRYYSDFKGIAFGADGDKYDAKTDDLGKLKPEQTVTLTIFNVPGTEKILSYIKVHLSDEPAYDIEFRNVEIKKLKSASGSKSGSKAGKSTRKKRK